MDIPKKMIALLLITILITASTSFAVSQFLQGNIRPLAIIDVDLIDGDVPFTVVFSSESYDPDGTIKKVEWQFGDGASSTKKTIEHRYDSKGVFTVLLTVWDDDGESATDTIYITVDQNENPVAVVTVNHTYGQAPLKAVFHGEGFDDDGYVSSYYWDFDDGTTSTNQHPTHWFNHTGTYIVTLNVTDDDGLMGNTFIKITVIGNQPPVAIASSNKNGGKAPKKIQFTGEVKDSDSSHHEYQWMFENQLFFQPDTSTEKNCSHWFLMPGTYKVVFTVTDDDGESDTDVLIIEINDSWFSRIVENIQNVTMTPFSMFLLRLFPTVITMITSLFE